MIKYIFKWLLLVLLIFFLVFINNKEETYAINDEIDPSTWYYVDGLGRSSTNNIVKSNKVRLVGMFYWTWHLDLNSPGPFNLNNILKNYPNAKNDYNNPIWKQYNAGVNGTGYYWWNEPIFGYYRENDDYVLRKQAELLADIGVDFIVFDCTNGDFTWENSYMNLLKVWLEAKNDGVKVPKVAFMFPFDYSADTSGVSFMSIYNNLYNPNSDNFKKYHSLLFDYNGKYLVLMNDYEKASDEIKNILKNFEVRKNYPAYFTSGANSNGRWGWLSTYPQAYYKKANGEAEQISVGVSMNANYLTNTITAMNGNNVMGRSYAKGNYAYSYKYRNSTINVGDTISGDVLKYNNTSYYGRNFQQQWDYALEIDPEVVFVTGWNEWLVSRFESWEGISNAFPDQFNDEYSRDIEPSNGELKDHYYYQLVDNIRKYKGASKNIVQEKEVSINKISDWNDSNIISYNHYTGGKNRDIVGFGTTNPVRYVNNSFRNDIRKAKVSYDNSYIYFYVETVSDLSDMKDDKWMRLLIDTVDSKESNSTDNWEEFEYIVNRNNIDNKMILERSIGGWDFKQIGSVDYKIDGNILSLKIPRSYLKLTNEDIKFNFKWCDNNLDAGDIMTIYTDGDSAPGGRFAFHFEGSSLYKEEKSIIFDSSLIIDDDKKYIFINKNNISVVNLLNKIKINNSNFTIKILSNEEKLKNNNSLVVTGDKLIIYENNEIIEEYLILILGDINSDGLVTIDDSNKLYDVIKNKVLLEDIYIKVSDVNNDSKIKISDVAKIYQYSKGKIKNIK